MPLCVEDTHNPPLLFVFLFKQGEGVSFEVWRFRGCVSFLSDCLYWCCICVCFFHHLFIRVCLISKCIPSNPDRKPSVTHRLCVHMVFYEHICAQYSTVCWRMWSARCGLCVWECVFIASGVLCTLSSKTFLSLDRYSDVNPSDLTCLLRERERETHTDRQRERPMREIRFLCVCRWNTSRLLNVHKWVKWRWLCCCRLTEIFFDPLTAQTLTHTLQGISFTTEGCYLPPQAHLHSWNMKTLLKW